MSRIEIRDGDRHVIVDHDGGDLAYVVEKAEKLWKATEGPEKSQGPAYGFQADRRWSADVAPLGNGAYTTTPSPVTASDKVSGFSGPTPTGGAQ